ncbi:hypothetical protein PB01_03925 [Psychrobacillus glaciei]|uniref:Uncharacterized protein n=1 Tax=Psychrobacillus glaciei TaxID=2283160 RepID=A0A5J6SKS7_9BACI|nr:hypothetical protein [Psychrobacillus glaciei]QFF98033.1 hypothetical protein PB01_03925 [Psychrobacillus glaciei]
MYKKAFAIFLILFISVLIVNINQATASSKVMWGKTELKIGQLGKATVLSNTVLWKMDKDNSLIKIRDLKIDEEYRVYSYKGNHGGIYGVGGGEFIQKSTSIKYETPSKSKLNLLAKLNKDNDSKSPGKQDDLEPITLASSPFGRTEHVFTIQGNDPFNRRLIVFNKITGKNVYIPADHEIFNDVDSIYLDGTKDFVFIKHYANRKKSTYRMSLIPPFEIKQVLNDIHDSIVFNDKLYFFNINEIDPITHKLNLMSADLDGSNHEVFMELEPIYIPTLRYYIPGTAFVSLQHTDSDMDKVSINSLNLETKELLVLRKCQNNSVRDVNAGPCLRIISEPF